MLRYIVLLLCFFSVNGNFVPSHSAALKEGVYYLYWQYTNDSITFEVQVKTTGYVGFGISPNGGMANSDIVIGWVKDGNNYFKDRFATGKYLPAIDPSQDWTLLNAVENGTWTSMRFTRKLKTCDKLDLDITEDTARIIWSYHTNDPTSETDIPYHTEKGVKSLQLLNYGAGNNPPAFPADAFTVDILQPNVSVPSKDTTYWCTAMKIQKRSQKHHVIKVEPIIPPGHESLVHHIIVYSCAHQVNESYHGHSGECRSRNMPDDVNCQLVTFAWAIGGTSIYYPEDVGFPFGEEDGPNFIAIETHYDNPGLRSDFVDASGLRLTMTPTLRKHDAGILHTGYVVSHGHMVPPGVASFTTVGTCPGECTQQGLGNQSINIISAFLHSHLLGRKIRVRHIRKGVELPIISEDNHYDFNYQEERMLKKQVEILPGDEIRTECTQDSTGRSYLTLGGLSTAEEMCLSFLMYYPRVNLNHCATTAFPINMAQIAGSGIQLKSYRITTNVELSAPAELANRTLYDILNNTVNWKDENTVKRFESLSTSTAQFVMCRGRNTSYPINFAYRYFLQQITTPLPPAKDMCLKSTSSPNTTVDISPSTASTIQQTVALCLSITIFTVLH